MQALIMLCSNLETHAVVVGCGMLHAFRVVNIKDLDGAGLLGRDLASIPSDAERDVLSGEERKEGAHAMEGLWCS